MDNPYCSCDTCSVALQARRPGSGTIRRGPSLYTAAVSWRTNFAATAIASQPTGTITVVHSGCGCCTTLIPPQNRTTSAERQQHHKERQAFLALNKPPLPRQVSSRMPSRSTARPSAWPPSSNTRSQPTTAPGSTSRRRDCPSAAPPLSTLVGVSTGLERECQQNDSLADG